MTSKLTIWYASNPADKAAWIKQWYSWPEREIFAHPDYVNLYVTPSSQTVCAAFESPHGSVLYPFLLRDLTVEPVYDRSMPPLKDIISAYGYGGAFVWGCVDLDELSAEFWPQFDAWAKQQHIVSEFIRFVLFTDCLLPYPGTTIEKSLNIVRDLAPDMDTMWMDFKHKVRKNVNRARKHDLRVTFDPTGAHLDDFLRIYESTMDRNEASDYYYFQRSYFESLNACLAGHYMYIHVWHQDRIVSTELVLVSSQYAYSFLGGTEEEAFNLRPNDLLKFEAIQWARQQGKRGFVLGGGYRPDDGIFRYKMSFAPTGPIPFYVGQRILRADYYDQLLANHPDPSQQPNMFPAYRA